MSGRTGSLRTLCDPARLKNPRASFALQCSTETACAVQPAVVSVRVSKKIPLALRGSTERVVRSCGVNTPHAASIHAHSRERTSGGRVGYASGERRQDSHLQKHPPLSDKTAPAYEAVLLSKKNRPLELKPKRSAKRKTAGQAGRKAGAAKERARRPALAGRATDGERAPHAPTEQGRGFEGGRARMRGRPEQAVARRRPAKAGGLFRPSDVASP